jgi:Predicted DNA-binding protein with PD1-like DNA-binding motif
MRYEQFGNQYVLRLEPGEEVRSKLTEFIEQENIGGGYFIAFGAFCRARLRYFDVAAKEYRNHEIDQQVEVVSLLGNIAWVDGKPKIHMHVAVSDGQTRTYSGDMEEGYARPTLELFLTKLPGEIRREKDPESGLDLLSLPHEMGVRRLPKRRKAA